VSAGKTGTVLNQGHIHLFPRHCERHKDRLASAVVVGWMACQSITAVYEFVDVEFQMLMLEQFTVEPVGRCFSTAFAMSFYARAGF
jgi:hypothetical protein